ncbi:MAG: efflux RND transporter periplasmic adaptor subunit [Gemmatimonadota bacterium]|nr:efflux RND transporter periplasmic adaptor subunit [Gemmatimonadota bacterium]
MMKMRCWGAALLVPIVVACGTEEVEEEESLQTWTVISGDMRLTAEATGNVEPIRAVEVTSKASGEVTRLYVDVGNEVEPGALLAEVDPRDVRNAFDQSQADLQVAQARAEISQAQLTRSEELLESGVISDQEHESRALDFANSRASVVRAETNFELAQLRLDDVIIRAPLAGTILEKNVEEGQVIQSASQNVSGGTTLVIMADLKFMQVRTLVDETDMGDIRAGMAATVTVEAYPQERFMGIVEKIEPQALVQQNVTMFPVIVQLDNDSGLLRPGMNAEVEIELAQESGVLLVPNNALVTPEDVQPASVVLGLEIGTIDTSNLFAGLGDGRGRPTADQTSAREGGRSGGRQGGATRGTGGGRGGAAFDSMRALMASGISQDSALVLLPEIANLFSGRRGGGGGGRGGFSGQGAVEQVGQAEPGEGTSGQQRETSRAVVFVVAVDGTTIEPRGVMVGLNDFDFTEVVSGLEEGDLIATIGAADLRASQDEMRNRGRPDFGGGRGGFR